MSVERGRAHCFLPRPCCCLGPRRTPWRPWIHMLNVWSDVSQGMERTRSSLAARAGSLAWVWDRSHGHRSELWLCGVCPSSLFIVFGGFWNKGHDITGAFRWCSGLGAYSVEGFTKHLSAQVLETSQPLVIPLLDLQPHPSERSRSHAGSYLLAEVYHRDTQMRWLCTQLGQGFPHDASDLVR